MKRLLAALALSLALGSHSAGAQTQAPITIGFAMSLTGGLAANGKSALLAMQIWAEE
ncbi:MAG: branched-chain amino acid ABC transporter substrate-binding protein, partial [Acetobacteraceae bacterium]|nr:branched-chain amino acid ABC transporter substrate-binding protein [Acetobacteraceae bacterium]